MTAHASIGIGAHKALAANVNYNDAVGVMLNTMVNAILPTLTSAVSNLSTDMNKALTKISDEQQAMVDEWGGDPAHGGYPANWDTWVATYGPGGPKEDPNAVAFINEINRLARDNPTLDYNWIRETGWNASGTFNGYTGIHADISKYLSQYQEQYNTTQLDFQNRLSAAQQPIDLWANTINAVNKSQVTNYKLMEPLTSIWKNLLNKTSNMSK